MGAVNEQQTIRVAQVAVEGPLPHLDRPFDYLVGEEVVPGTRVKVTFAGRERDGWVLSVRERDEELDGGRTLAHIRRLVSPLAYLTPEVLRLARAVADRYVGTLTDVLRFAVPPRHARTEKAVLAAVERAQTEPPAVGEPSGDATGWDQVTGGAALLARLRAGEAPRAVWTHAGLPEQARSMILAAAQATRAAGRGVLVVVPDARDVDRLAGLLRDGLGEEVGRLVASDGPSVRARAHLRALVGLSHVVVGTRSAAWAPVADLGLAVCWDDGDDSLAEQRAPYPQAAQVLAMRAEPERTALLVGGTARSAWAQHLVATGWAVSLRAERATVRAATARVDALDEADLARSGGPARIPTPAWRAIKDGLASGPVLVQVPRAGYVPHLVCAQCREVAQCTRCAGALAMTDTARAPVCVACGELAEHWRCPACSGTRLRAMRVGAARTAEELGRAFPQIPVVVSSADRGVVADVDARARLVVATPGAEPEAEGGFAVVVLLDGALATSLPGMGGGEEAARRWFHAASLARAEGRVVIAGGGDASIVQAVVRGDPVTFAERDLAERRELRFPPTVRAATLTGPLAAVTDLLMEIELPDPAELLGPFPAPLPPGAGGEEQDTVRAVLRAPLAAGGALSAAIRAGLAIRSAHKRDGAVRVVVDPREL